MLCLQCHLAGGFHLGAGYWLDRSQDAQAGTEGLFGVSPGGQDGLDQLAGLRSDLFRPALQAFGCPFAGFLVLGRHMSGLGRVAAGNAAARMDGHGFGFALVEDLQHALSGPDTHFLVDQGIRDGVEVFFELDVVVNVHPGGFPGGIFKGRFRQGTQGRLVQFFEQLPPGFFQVLHLAIVHLFQQVGRLPGSVRPG